MHNITSRFFNQSTRVSRAALLALVTAFPLAAPAAHAGQYVLEKGKGVEVCEAYEKNLNSFKPRGPFRGNRPINPEFKDFSKPDLKGWVEDPTPGSRTFPEEKIDRFLWERDANPVYSYRGGIAKWRGTPAQYEEAWKRFKFLRRGPGIQTADREKIGAVDIDNDGTPDNVYLDERGNDLGAPLLVLNADRSDLDYAKTKLVMQHPSRKEQGLGELRKLAPGERATAEAEKFGYTPFEDSLHGASYDVFQYKNRTYFDLWWIRHTDYQGKLDFEVGVGKPLRVFVIENNRTREVCTYKYID